MVHRIRTAAITFSAQNSKAKICIGVSKIAGVGDLPVGKKEPFFSGSPETWLETIKVILGPGRRGPRHYSEGSDLAGRRPGGPLKLQGHKEPWSVKFWGTETNQPSRCAHRTRCEDTRPQVHTSPKPTWATKSRPAWMPFQK